MAVYSTQFAVPPDLLGVDPGPIGRIEPTMSGQVFEVSGTESGEPRVLSNPTAAGWLLFIRIKVYSTDNIIYAERGFYEERAEEAEFSAQDGWLMLISVTATEEGTFRWLTIGQYQVTVTASE